MSFYGSESFVGYVMNFLILRISWVQFFEHFYSFYELEKVDRISISSQHIEVQFCLNFQPL